MSVLILNFYIYKIIDCYSYLVYETIHYFSCTSKLLSHTKYLEIDGAHNFYSGILLTIDI